MKKSINKKVIIGTCSLVGIITVVGTGGIAHYVGLHLDVRKQNKLLQEIQARQNEPL